MSTTLEPPRPAPEARDDPIDIHAFEHHWQDEADAAYLYRILADAEQDAKKKEIYARLASVEDRHVTIWTELLAKHGRPPGTFKPSGRARLLSSLGKMFGPNFLLPMLLEEEGREVKAYLDMHRGTPHGAPGGPEALLLARESADHATTLGEISGKGAEPWHRTASGGFLRNVVYGFNDGLTANFGLVAGVIGAGVVNQHQAVVVAGVAGLIADALSMGSSGYLASKSEREVYEYEISMEKTEVELMPEIERDELAVIYEAKGMDRDSAHNLATQIMADPALMLKEQVQEELKIGEYGMSPLREGWLTGMATAFGAAIPVFPFLVWHGTTAIVIAFALSMLSHFVVGAARSVFTGRGAFRSGLDMFVVGMGVALVGYFVGGWIGKLI
jgi:VIT1/CCC1 family predicted Fe2+/Mn2+ transporter